MSQSPGVWQAPKRTSIDGTTPDKALDAARAAYPQAGSHADVGQAVAYVLSGSAPFGRTAQLVGHGASGLIGVGCGKYPVGPADYIGLNNEAVWAPLLNGLFGHVQFLRLTGCYVGSGADGAELVERVSCAIGAPVLAPNGWAQAVAPANITLQDGSVWQVGQCHIAPHPIPMPNKPTPPPSSALLFMTKEGEAETVPVERVARLDFSPTAFRASGAAEDELHLVKKDAQALLADERLAEPQRLEGELLALPTGELNIVYVTEDGAERVRTFDVLADELLQDREAPGFVYLLGEELRAALPTLPRRD